MTESTAPGESRRVVDLVCGIEITEWTPVLPSHRLSSGTRQDTLPVFGDQRWDLSAAVPDRHNAGQAIRWDIYPAPLRHSTKIYVFALLNLTEDPPRLPSARSRIPAVKTIWSDLVFLRVFLHWLQDHDIVCVDEVTHTDLDRYLAHIQDRTGMSPAWKRRALMAVQRLHTYRDHLPGQVRLPAGRLWGGASAANLARDSGPDATNRTPRIHPATMQPLLSAALLVVEVVAADLLPAVRRLLEIRRAVHDAVEPTTALDMPPRRGAGRWQATVGRLPAILDALERHHLPLPGRHGRNGRLLVDVAGLALATGLERTILDQPACRRRVDNRLLQITPDLLRATKITEVAGRAWRDAPVNSEELAALLRHVTTAAFLVIAYLSGMRTGEVLNLRRGCVTRDPALDMIFLSGVQLKTDAARRKRNPATTPWVITEPAAAAIAVLEDLAPGTFLFPIGELGARDWIEQCDQRSRTPGAINSDIGRFIDWFNTSVAAAIGHDPIPDDEHGAVTAPRLRRTLAWHIVRRPGGTVAAAIQYGHLHTQITQGYAGNAAAGFIDDITFEEFLLRAEQIHHDQELLDRGEHVSGPAAGTYRDRLAIGSGFHGTTITSRAQLQDTKNNPALQVHHGELLTCVFRPETALCCSGTDSGDTPRWKGCRSQCTNIARTDRDVAAIRSRVLDLRLDLAGPALPDPLHRRVEEQITFYTDIIRNHVADPTGAPAADHRSPIGHP